MRHLLHKGDGREGQLGNGLALEERRQKAEDDDEHERHDGAGLELGEREVAARLLEGELVAVHLLGLGLGGGVGRGRGLHALDLLGGAVDRGPQGLVVGGAVDEQPADALAHDGGHEGDGHDQHRVAISCGRHRPLSRRNPSRCLPLASQSLPLSPSLA